jgi:hypothetical protein
VMEALRRAALVGYHSNALERQDGTMIVGGLPTAGGPRGADSRSRPRSLQSQTRSRASIASAVSRSCPRVRTPRWARLRNLVDQL